VSDQRIDNKVVGELREVMGSQYAELLETFLADCEKRMVQLRDARSPRQLSEAAHSFKGSCSNMGATDLAELCRQLEVRVMEQPAHGIEDLISQIRCEYLEVRPFYVAELERVSPQAVRHPV
jgi:HPt (histidine-containing phosphotransfer) domain-containing protein